ncbi:hypothetical protein V3C99_013296 [Haemonchus contortus]
MTVDFEVPGKRSREAPRKRWRDMIKKDTPKLKQRQKMPWIDRSGDG